MKYLPRIAAASVLAVTAAWAAPQVHPPPAQPQPVTRNLQGHEPPSADDPRIRAFYDALVSIRAEKLDPAKIDARMRELARAHAPAGGLDAKGWEDHVVDMAHQLLEIGKKDPKIFDSYQSFATALGGPP